MIYRRQFLQPAGQAAVDRRNPIDEQQVCRPQRPGLAIENGQVIVGMAGAMGMKGEDTPAQIELGLVGDE